MDNESGIEIACKLSRYRLVRGLVLLYTMVRVFPKGFCCNNDETVERFSGPKEKAAVEVDKPI